MAVPFPDSPTPNPDTEARLVAEIRGARYVPTEVKEEDGRLRIVDRPWVPFVPGFEIPLRFDYHRGGELAWALQILVVEGRPQVYSLTCLAPEVEWPITAERLHRFRLARFVKEATLMASRPVDELPHSFVRWSSVAEVEAARKAVASQLRKRPNGKRRHKLTDEFLVEVAEVYRRHVAVGTPSKAVAEHFHYTEASARRLVREARLRGFLGAARAGRAGEMADTGAATPHDQGGGDGQ
jgi:hypothetical protein